MTPQMNPEPMACWDPQWPNPWIPNPWCIGIPNGQTNGSQTRGVLGSPMTPQMDPKPVVHWDPQCPNCWIPNLRCIGIPIDPTDESRTHGASGSPMAKPMDPTLGINPKPHKSDPGTSAPPTCAVRPPTRPCPACLSWLTPKL